MNREIRGCRVEGDINYRGRNVNTKTENTYELRRSIGMVFQQPNPFRKSIRDNITFAPKRHGITDRDEARPHGRGEPARRGTVGRGQGQAR